ncbi:hypothetical protein Q3G72_029139 [Acer saccharum]|nr:hypothetical protein Q3G72_029139 [Acer saccharum]
MAENLQQQTNRRRSRLSRVFTAQTNHQQQQQQQPPPFSSSSSTSPTLFPSSLLQLNQPPPSPPLPPHLTTYQYQLPFNLNQPHYYYDTVSVLGDYFLKQQNTTSSSVPLGPFTGYASILMRSRFLKPAQQILDDFCGGFYSCEAIILSSDSHHHQVDYGGFNESGVASPFGANTGFHQCSILDASSSPSDVGGWSAGDGKVYRKYKLYCQQIQSVVASFETVAGLGNAAPYISTAFKAISKHFSYLKNAIIDQIQVPGKTIGDRNVGKDKIPGLLLAEQGIHCSQKPEKNQRYLQYPVWRTQRGLPEHAVSVLKTWLFENFLHPYPTDSEKQILSQQTGLSRTQVSNWFINARVRLWKPMVEEIHKLEKQQSQTSSEAANLDVNMPSSAEKFPESTREIRYPKIIPTKPPKNKSISTTPNQEPIIQNSSFRNLSSNQQQHIGGVTATGSSSAEIVSLALGLCRNIGNELSEARDNQHCSRFQPGNGC